MQIAQWSRSSVPLPMTELEYDILAGPYSTGYGAALSTVFQKSFSVVNQRYEGHLYSTLVEGDAEAATARSLGPLLLGPLLWKSEVIPLMRRHFDDLQRLEADSHRDADRLPRLFQDNVLVHHLMLLPIRLQIGQLVNRLSVKLAKNPSEQGVVALDVLDVTTPRDLPVAAFIEQLAEVPNGTSPDRTIPLNEVAPDGDGYGIAVPGWLDDPEYVARYRRLLQRWGVAAEAVRARVAASAARATEAFTRLQHLAAGTDLCKSLVGLAHVAAHARVTELHGPLMHVEHMQRLRRVLMAWGAQLATKGRLEAPDDIVHLRLSELCHDAWDGRLVQERRMRYTAQRAAPLPPPRAAWPLEVGRPLGDAGSKRLGALDDPPVQEHASGRWCGVPAAPGIATGHLVYLQRQADLDQLGHGDIAVTPDGGAPWGWLAFAGVPLLVMHGSRLGHAATLARLAGTPCVIAPTDPAEVLPPKTTVHLSGDTGRIDW